MIIKFLGTRGGIIARSKEHYMHSSILISYRKINIMIDCGQDWLDKVYSIKPNAIFITHGHKDHVGGLKNGAPCPVYLTQDTLNIVKNYKIRDIVLLKNREVIEISKIKLEVFDVIHSLRAPAVGYRISTKNKSIFYVPDLVKIKNEKEALSNLNFYIGDGAIIKSHNLIKNRDDTQIGHSPIIDQALWCKKYNINNFIVTHCGSQITKGNIKKIDSAIKEISKEFNIKIKIAYDNMLLKV